MLTWFCVRSHPKHEHIAAAYLEKEMGLEVFLPRIRFKRATRRGAVWFTEALFANYIFARFDLALHLRRLHHGRGVQGVVHFGGHWPVVQDEVIADLRASIGNDQIHVVSEDLHPGEIVLIAEGAFVGLRAVVERVMPARCRVAVLLEFLGRQTKVEICSAALVPDSDPRARM